MPSKAGKFLLIVPLAIQPLQVQTPGPKPVFATEVTVVSLPVFVTDKDGKAVASLTAEDFEVQDEGKPMKLVGFQEIDATQPLPPLGFRGVVAAQRQFLLLFDLSFTNVSGLIRARAAAKDFVTSRLGPSDLAGVATISVTGGARLLLGFTSDRRQLQRAVEGLGLLDPDRKADPLAITYDSGLAEPLPADGGGKSEAKDAILAAEVHSTQVAFTQGQLEDYRRKVGSVVASLSNLARALDAIQGRKQILYMSAGYSDTLMAGETGDAQRESSEAVVEGRLWEVQSDAHFGDSGARNQMEKMLKSFANADVVVHTIDVMGLGGGPDALDIGRTTPDLLT